MSTAVRNLRLLVSYDGTDFAGWQTQSGQRTVQEEMERAISELTGQPVRLLCAGRTDAGVHSLGQVASFETRSTIPTDRWRLALQVRLPRDIILRDVQEVPLRFHATYSAKSKRYRYLINNSTTDDILLRRFCWRFWPRLEIERMQTAANHLLGTHDFRSFESRWPNKATSVRTVQEVLIYRTRHAPMLLGTASHSEQRGAEDFVVIEIAADGFLYNMVRIIVGTLVEVGRGARPPEDVLHILEGQDRRLAGDTCPAHGLFLVEVQYPRNEDEL